MNYSISTLIGILFFVNQKVLEIDVYFVVLLVILLIFSAIYGGVKQKATSVIFLIFGYALAALFSHQNLHVIDTQYYNKYHQITGVITSLVDRQPHKDNFVFASSAPFQAKLKLSIYGKNRPKLSVGQQWQFSVKVKQNNGYSNIGSFEYERWLFMQNIDATGYVNIKKPYKFIAQTHISYVNQIRQNMSNMLDTLLPNLAFRGLIKALTIGDKSEIKQQDRDSLIKTNTAHLSVISGLHLGIIASVVFFLVFFIVSKLRFVINVIPVVIIASMVTIFATFMYMALAGFSVPTMRAFIIITVFMIATSIRMSFHRWQIYFFALFVVLVINPLSVLGNGFWLSFIATAIILYFANFHNFYNNIYQKIIKVIYLQILISALMFPFILLFFNEFSLISPLANIIAIPIFSILIVPLSFLAMMMLFFGFTQLSSALFYLVDYLLHCVFVMLDFFANIPHVQISYTIVDNWHLAVVIFTSILLFLHRKLRVLFVAIVLVFAMILANVVNNNHLHILDVGQGLAAIFTMGNNAIVFDTGNKFVSGFNLGDAVIHPFLRNKNINNIEKIVISHKDKDHSGGLGALLKKYSVVDIITEENKRCRQENSWQSGDWKFRILSTDSVFSGNNNSCVIKMSNGKKSILWTGDIEKKAEKYLLAKYGNILQSDVLIAPHHGSKTSSSLEFLRAVQPKMVIISAGFQNSYKHPHPEVLARYKQLKITVFNTICSGQISIDLTDFSVSEYRKDNAKYYHRMCHD